MAKKTKIEIGYVGQLSIFVVIIVIGVLLAIYADGTSTGFVYGDV